MSRPRSNERLLKRTLKFFASNKAAKLFNWPLKLFVNSSTFLTRLDPPFPYTKILSQKQSVAVKAPTSKTFDRFAKNIFLMHSKSAKTSMRYDGQTAYRYP
jgi:hypothetical protein